MDSLQGQLLIAAPRLSDPNFFHTVVFMVQHSEEGALGLVLNRPLETSVRDVWKQVSDGDCLIEGSIHQGGPCEGPLMVLHSDEAGGDMDVMPGITMSTNREAIEKLVTAGASPTRFFVGYAGWTAGQLEAELESASWLTCDAELEHVFEDHDDLWQQLHRAVTRAAQTSWIPPEIMPDDPSLN
ncbi:YqgE/AlgH family protein [Humisphaera borealis]|uniref:YqgE/AlgH family protein n=1 Tax=Humisphaera borealis TaxID=2807512 RepID=A0A7M2X293_9BACT|nr:YqgE/AlgH family protein [Humisphaera borealis]QOV91896.1 YqgE/AlgH family protein [Humisphaera borealis]